MQEERRMRGRRRRGFTMGTSEAGNGGDGIRK
jgi:hypothetical protein